MSPNYEPLRVLSLSKDFVEKVYFVIQRRPFEREASLRNQMKRAAISISSNIAEGDGRGYSKEGIRFFKIAIASAEEVKSQLEFSAKIGLVSQGESQELCEQCSVICRMLNKLIQSRLNRKNHLE